MHELILKWTEAGQERTQAIWDKQPSKNPGTVRIGRDPTRCDIVLLHRSVSGLHIEIFYAQQQHYFYLRNLRETNPPVVDGEKILQGEVILKQGSIIYLGQIKLKVVDILPRFLESVESFVESSVNSAQFKRSPVLALNDSQENAINSLQTEVKSVKMITTKAGESSLSKSENSTEKTLPTYGLKCPKCERISAFDRLYLGCSWCGKPLTSALSVLMGAEALKNLKNEKSS